MAFHTENGKPALPGTSTLKSLKSELGFDAPLLDRIPFTSVILVRSEELIQYLPYKIFVGTTQSGHKKLDVWGFLLSDLRMQDGVLRQFIYARYKGDVLIKTSSDEMDSSKRWLLVCYLSKGRRPVRRSVLIKISRLLIF